MKGQAVISRIGQFFAKHGVKVSVSPTITLCGILTFSLGTGVSLLPNKWNKEDEERIAELVNAVVKISFEEFKQNLLKEINKRGEDEVAAVFEKARAVAGKPIQQVIQLLTAEPVLTVRQFKKRTEIVKLLQYKFIGRTAELKNFNLFLDVSDEKIGLVIDRGGTGKTRISIELAERLEKLEEWNVYFVHPIHKFLPFTVVGKTLLILDEASRYNSKDELIDFVLNPPAGSGSFKLLVIDRPIFQESFESYLSERGEHAIPIKIGQADIIAFLEANYGGIDSEASEKIAQKSDNSFVYAALFAEYYQKKRSVPGLAKVVDETVQKYIKDIAIETGKPTRSVRQAIEILSLIEPLNWDKDETQITKGSGIDQFEALEAIVTTCIDSDFVVVSDGICTIKPDPISDCVRLSVLNKKRWSAFFYKLHTLFPFRIAYNIFPLPRLDPSIVEKIGSALHDLWVRLNDTAELEVSPEYFFAIHFFTSFFGRLPFCDVAEANRQLWISRYITCRKQYPDDEFRELFISSLANVSAAYNKVEQSEILKKRVDELEVYHLRYNCRELRIAFARELVNATRFFVRTNKLHETLFYLAKLRELDKPDDLEIAEWTAKGIVNSVEILGKSGKTSEMECCLTELRNLSETYLSTQLKSILISGLVNALTSYAALGVLDKVDDCLKELEGLQTPFKDQNIKPPSIDLIVPSASLFSRVVHTNGTKDECLHLLANCGEQGQQAIVASAASFGFGTVGKLEKMERYLQEFKSLINAFGSKKCNSNIAAASYFAIEQYTLRKNFEKAEEHYQAIADIYQYPDSELALWLARSSLKIADMYGGVSSFVKMEKHVDTLRSLGRDYRDTEVTNMLAIGLLNSSFFYGGFWKLTAMENRLQELRQVYSEASSVETGRYLAQCLGNTIVAYLKIGGFEQVQEHLGGIRSIYAQHHDTKILKSFALALYNGIPMRTLVKSSSYADLTLLYQARFVLNEVEDSLQKINYITLLFALEAINSLYRGLKNGVVESIVITIANPKTSIYTIQMWVAYLLHLKKLSYPYIKILSGNVTSAYAFYDQNEWVLDQDFSGSAT